MADIADLADEYQQSRLDAAIKTSNNLSVNYYKAIEGDGFCLDCGKSVDQQKCRIKSDDDSWVEKMIYPRFCCPECRTMWERDN